MAQFSNLNRYPWPTAEAPPYPVRMGPPAALRWPAALWPTDFLRPWVFAAALASHALLGLALIRFEALATVHALLTLGIGVVLGLMSRSAISSICAASYAAGSECLWRLTHAQIFWEFGKYSAIVILLVALYRMNRPRMNTGAAWYFLLLLPSAVITFSELPLDDARQRVSFNLSGPLLMAVGIVVFSNLRLHTGPITPRLRVFHDAAGQRCHHRHLRHRHRHKPALLQRLERRLERRIGPNQVSAALGLGLFFAILCVLDDHSSLRIRIVLFLSLLLFAGQSAMTFSRSGLYNAGFATLLAMVYLIRISSVRIRLAQIFPAFVVLVLIAWPRIDAFTEGSLAERFADTNPDAPG